MLGVYRHYAFQFSQPTPGPCEYQTSQVYGNDVKCEEADTESLSMPFATFSRLHQESFLPKQAGAQCSGLCMLLCPLLRRLYCCRLILLPCLCDIVGQWVVGVGSAEQGLDGEEDGADLKSG